MGEFSVPRKLAPPPQLSSISFSGGGWLQFYLYGVAKAMQSCGIVDLTHVKVCGCSAGALAAAGLVYDGDFDGAVDFAKYECIPRAHSEISGLFKLGLYVGECVELHMLPKYRKLASRLEIAITKLPSLQAVRVSNFDTVDDFKSCLLASCAAFPLAPLVYRKGSWWVDGGFTDFQPIVNENTLTVSPFYFRYEKLVDGCSVFVVMIEYFDSCPSLNSSFNCVPFLLSSVFMKLIFMIILSLLALAILNHLVMFPCGGQ